MCIYIYTRVFFCRQRRKGNRCPSAFLKSSLAALINGRLENACRRRWATEAVRKREARASQDHEARARANDTRNQARVGTLMYTQLTN